MEPMELYDFQRVDVDVTKEHNGVGIVVAEMGAGKTLYAIEAAHELGAEVVLIIAPEQTHRKEWIGTTARQHPDISVRVVNGTEKGEAAYADFQIGEPGWYVMSPQTFTIWGTDKYKKDSKGRKIKLIRRRKLVGIDPDLVIVDEAHLISNWDSTGREALLDLKPKMRIAMSGTPFRNKFENMYALMCWLYPGRNGAGDIADINRQRWISTWCETVADPHSPTGRKVIGERTPGELAKHIPNYIQHFKRQECCEFHPEGFLSELPAPVTIVHKVKMLDEQKRIASQLEDAYLMWLKDSAETKKVFITKFPIVKQARLRQLALAVPGFQEVGVDKDGGPAFEIFFPPGCASPKIDLFMDRIMDEGEEQWLAYTSSQKFAYEVARRLNEIGISAREFSGKVTKKNRLEIRDQFAKGEVQVVVAVTEAIGTGVDGLQFVTNRAFWFDRSQDLSANNQAESRLDRRGQGKQVINEVVEAIGSADSGVLSSQIQRQLKLNKSLRRDFRRANGLDKPRRRPSWQM